MKTSAVLGAFVVAALSLVPVASAGDGADVVPNRFCSVQLVEGGPTDDGVGITVEAPSGYSHLTCRVDVPPPGRAVVQTFPETKGDVLVISASGKAHVHFRQCGPSEPVNPACGG